MYRFFYDNGVGFTEFFPLIDSFSIIRERSEDNPFIIRELISAKLSVSGPDFTFFETFKGTGNDISGYFTETIGLASKQYNCTFSIEEEIDYSTKFLSLSLNYKDKYWNLLDDPETNIETFFEIPASVLDQAIFLENEPNPSYRAYRFNDLLEYCLSQVDNTINFSETYDWLITNGYNHVYINILNDFKIIDFINYLSINSPLSVYFYLTNDNKFILENAINLIHGFYSIDLTNYAGVNWGLEKRSILKFDKKLSKIEYLNEFTSSSFQNSFAIFPKNNRNEESVTSQFLTDITHVGRDNLNLLFNCNEINTPMLISQFNNSDDLPFDTFTTNTFGTVQSATNSTAGARQYARNDGFQVEKYSVINLTWNKISGTGGKVEIGLQGGGDSYNKLVEFDISDEQGSYVALEDGLYIIATSITLEAFDAPKNFSIDTFVVNLVKYEIKKTDNIYNYSFASRYMLPNFASYLPDTYGILNQILYTDLNAKPSQTEEIEFPYAGLISDFPFENYVKTAISEQMIPYRLERTVLSLDSKGFDKLLLKKR